MGVSKTIIKKKKKKNFCRTEGVRFIFTSVMSSKRPHCNSKNMVEVSLPCTIHPQITPQILRSLCHMWVLYSLDRKGAEEDLARTTKGQPTLHKPQGHHSLSNDGQFGGQNWCLFIVTGPIHPLMQRWRPVPLFYCCLPSLSTEGHRGDEAHHQFR